MISGSLHDNEFGNGRRIMNIPKRRILLETAAISIALTLTMASAARAQETPSDYQQVLEIVGKSGDFKSNVLKVNIPRSDLHVKIAGYGVPTPFGFGGWFALAKGDGGEDVMMGDLVLTQDEVNPVMSALLEHGLEVTALHNHFFWEKPHLFFMHVHGHGKAVDLANEIKPALNLIGKSKSSVQAKQGTLDTERIAKIVGHAGEQNGDVYKITVGRDDLNVKEMGATINSRMGLNTWAAFVGSNGDAAVAGDVAMLEDEVTPTLKALRSHGLDVVAIHHHMLNTKPTIIFLHYWGRGPADKLATGFKAALDELGKGSRQ
jgi:hypothetical protein